MIIRITNIYINQKMAKCYNRLDMKIMLWEARTFKKISLRELSEKTGISKSALNNYETEKRSPTMDDIEKIAIALNIRITDLFDSVYK